MSGGVDSAVTAHLIRKMGYDACGATIRMFSKADPRFCPMPSSDPDAEINDAKKVAELIGIPHFVYDYSAEFAESVLRDFISSYLSGKTPNPCIVCNKHIKFGRFLASAKENGFDKIATGHYASVEKSASGRYLLKKASDPKKDQTYVLYSLTQSQLANTVFPLGSYTKAEVREIAASLGFSNSEKHDSQDICFIPDGDYASFIMRYTGKGFEPGNFLDRDGNIIGKHRGSPLYTIGQRKGLGVSLGQPMYVCEKSAKNNTVTLGLDRDLFSTSLDAENINFIPFDRLDAPMRVTAKIRYSQSFAPAWLEQTSDNTFHLEFDVPQRAVTPGQSAVLYDGEYVIGGGIIK